MPVVYDKDKKTAKLDYSAEQINNKLEQVETLDTKITTLENSLNVVPVQTDKTEIVIRIGTTAKEDTTIEFDVVCSEFLVTNMSSGNAYVSFGSSISDNKNTRGLLIPSECSRSVFIDRSGRYGTDTLTILTDVTTTNEVEIQCVRW